jgi:hypothetical protein
MLLLLLLQQGTECTLSKYSRMVLNKRSSRLKPTCIGKQLKLLQVVGITLPRRRE